MFFIRWEFFFGDDAPFTSCVVLSALLDNHHCYATINSIINFIGIVSVCLCVCMCVYIGHAL